MVIYEVNIQVDAEKASEYAAWLPGHIQRVLQCDGFRSATRWQVEETVAGGNSWCIHYEVATREQLANYFATEAPRLREEGLTLFGEHFTAVRRVLVNPKRYP